MLMHSSGFSGMEVRKSIDASDEAAGLSVLLFDYDENLEIELLHNLKAAS